MTQFISFDENIEVKGKTILDVTGAVDFFGDIPLRILEENGLKDIDPEKWYSQQEWLYSFKILMERLGETALYEVGRRILENVDWPKNIEGLEMALESIDMAYHMNHRKNGEILYDETTGDRKDGIGNYCLTRLSENKFEVVCINPYPCEFDMGILDSVANRFKPFGSIVKIIHDNSRDCRKNGKDSCTYVIEWENIVS